MIDDGRPRHDPEAHPDRVDRVEEGWRRERPDIDVSSVGIVTRIWRIGRHLDRHRKERLEAFGTDRVALEVLAMLRRAGPPYRRTAGELQTARRSPPADVAASGTARGRRPGQPAHAPYGPAQGRGRS